MSLPLCTRLVGAQTQADTLGPLWLPHSPPSSRTEQTFSSLPHHRSLQVPPYSSQSVPTPPPRPLTTRPQALPMPEGAMCPQLCLPAPLGPRCCAHRTCQKVCGPLWDCGTGDSQRRRQNGALCEPSPSELSARGRPARTGDR